MARLTPFDRSTHHRPGAHALDDAGDDFPYADGGYTETSDDVAPLQFDISPGRPATAYVTPRPSRWQNLRMPLTSAALGAALIAMTWTAWAQGFTEIARWSSALADREGDGRTQASVTVVLSMMIALVFVAGWWRSSHPRRPVRLADERGTIAVDAIAGQLRSAILDLPEVRDAEVAVENRGGSQVRVRTWLRITAEARIDDVLDGVDTAADWLVHHRMGLVLSEPPLAEVRYDELNLRAARPSFTEGATERPDGELDD
ncbi:MAG: hypothetical protein O2924_02555 [Chloroflexi bacterium]|nr:hypothetical protein [Chloroflexota bacterium]MQC16907.1 hypothetical protein [Chloroflexota bacterium]